MYAEVRGQTWRQSAPWLKAGVPSPPHSRAPGPWGSRLLLSSGSHWKLLSSYGDRKLEGGAVWGLAVSLRSSYSQS